MDRRTFISTLPLAALPGAIASKTQASDSIGILCVIADNTGLSLDDIYHWTKGLSQDALYILAKNTQTTPLGTVRQINYHGRRAQSLLNEITPPGCESANSYYFVGNNIGTGAFPPNWQRGQPYMQFIGDKGWVQA